MGSLISVTNSTFTNNFAAGAGGALYYLNEGCFKNVTFINNSAGVSTGGYYVGGAIMDGATDYSKSSFDNCTFINNAVRMGNSLSHGGAICLHNYGNITNCVFIGNVAYEGGAITPHKGGYIANCTFIGNNATIKYGGAISTFAEGDDELIIDNCSFVNNSAPSGGAIYTLDNGKTLPVTISNSKFIGNNATNNGGAVYIKGENTVITNSSFNANNVNSYGGAVYVEGDNTEISNSNFTENNASVSGAAISVSGDLTLSNSTFKNNTATNDNAINYANGKYSANGNSFDHIKGKANIYNTGKFPNVNVNVLDGKTLINYYGSIAKIYADVTDLEGATISGGSFYFTIDGGDPIYASSAEGHYELNYTIDFVNMTKKVNATYENAEKQNLISGYLYSGKVSSIGPIITVNNTIYGDTTKITIKVPTTETVNIPTGNIIVSGIINGTFTLDSNGEYSTTIDALSVGKDYIIDVVYSGDICYYGNSNKTTFNISKAQQPVNVVISNMVYGVDGTVNVSVEPRGKGAIPTVM